MFVKSIKSTSSPLSKLPESYLDRVFEDRNGSDLPGTGMRENRIMASGNDWNYIVLKKLQYSIKISLNAH